MCHCPQSASLTTISSSAIYRYYNLITTSQQPHYNLATTSLQKASQQPHYNLTTTSQKAFYILTATSQQPHYNLTTTSQQAFYILTATSLQPHCNLTTTSDLILNYVFTNAVLDIFPIFQISTPGYLNVPGIILIQPKCSLFLPQFSQHTQHMLICGIKSLNI